MEEMRPPMCQEIGLVVRESKMGVTLEESLRHLEKKMEYGRVIFGSEFNISCQRNRRRFSDESIKPPYYYYQR